MKLKFTFYPIVLMVIAFTCASHLSSFAQDTTKASKIMMKAPKFKHELGLAAGFTTGYGLSYRCFPTKYGFQFTFAPYKKDEYSQYSTGVTFYYKLFENNLTSFFIYQGNHFFYVKENVWGGYNTYGYTYSQHSRTTAYLNNGIGFGFEVMGADRISFNLMGGYAFYDSFKNINVTGEMGLFFKL